MYLYQMQFHYKSRFLIVDKDLLYKIYVYFVQNIYLCNICKGECYVFIIHLTVLLKNIVLVSYMGMDGFRLQDNTLRYNIQHTVNINVNSSRSSSHKIKTKKPFLYCSRYVYLIFVIRQALKQYIVLFFL